MKFQCDAHISREMVAMIRGRGHDCLEAGSLPPRMPDEEVLRRAAGEGRVVLTADKDFGELVFVHRVACPGVILLRIALPHEVDRVRRLDAAWPAILSRLPGSFITVTADAVRVRPLDIASP